MWRREGPAYEGATAGWQPFVTVVMGGRVTHDGLRAQKTVCSVIREEVEHEQYYAPRDRSLHLQPRLWRSDRIVRHSSGVFFPTLSLPVPAGVSREAVDSSSLRFLTAAALAARRKEKEEVRAAEIQRLGPGAGPAEAEEEKEE